MLQTQQMAESEKRGIRLESVASFPGTPKHAGKITSENADSTYFRVKPPGDSHSAFF